MQFQNDKKGEIVDFEGLKVLLILFIESNFGAGQQSFDHWII